jgi:hypothetical protein
VVSGFSLSGFLFTTTSPRATVKREPTSRTAHSLTSKLLSEESSLVENPYKWQTVKDSRCGLGSPLLSSLDGKTPGAISGPSSLDRETDRTDPLGTSTNLA